MWEDWIGFLVTALICVAIGLAVTFVVTGTVRLVARKREWPQELTRRAKRPFRVLVLLLSVWLAVTQSYPDAEVAPLISHGLAIAAIGVVGWLLIALVQFGTDMMLGQFRTDVPDNRQARRIRTQTLILRRLSIALIVTIAVASMLLTFPAVQTIGASLLASAGIASVVAGLAAQSALSNVFAGVQLVFSDALRVDDVLVVDGEWGRVGEITLSYVVLDIWDQRRLILPCTYFTTQPFENWTRRGSELLGAVEFDVDWRVSVDGIRERLAEILDGNELWDGRTGVAQITDSTGGMIRVRVLVSAVDSANLWDLRCLVREELVDFIQSVLPDALPTQRLLVGSATEATKRAQAAAKSAQEAVDAGAEPSTDTRPNRAGLFSGSEDADERRNQFTQAIPLPARDDEQGREPGLEPEPAHRD